MKKLFTTALAALAVFGMSAADKVIYQDGALSAGVEPNPWYAAGFNLAAPSPSGSGVAYQFYTQDAVDNGCMGFLNNGSDFACGVLNNSTLEFEWYATGAAKYTIRLTAVGGAEENYVFYADESNINKWNKVSLPVATTFPNVNTQWKEYKGDGAGFVFAVIQNDFQAPTPSIYFNNIVYKNIDESWKAPEQETYPAPTTVPVPVQPAADVKSLLSGAYTPAISFGIGGWGQTTLVTNMTIADSPVEYLKNFNYLGWELNGTLDLTGYSYMHVDYYTPNGTDFGYTPISNYNGVTKEKATRVAVKQNEWNSYDLALADFGIDLESVFQVKFDFGGGAEGYIANVYFYKSGDNPDQPDQPGENKVYTGVISDLSYTPNLSDAPEYKYNINYSITYNTDKTLTVKANYDWKNGEPVGATPGEVWINNVMNTFPSSADRVLTTTDTYNAGDVITVLFRLPIAGGVMENPIQYTVGSGTGTVGAAVVDAENAPVEYYNLQGVRVANPENGLFIRRQGNKTTKVIIK